MELPWGYVYGTTDTYLTINAVEAIKMIAGGGGVIIAANVVPSGNATIGASDNKWLAGYFTNVPACPVPTSNSALEVIKKIKAPKIRADDRYGERHYFMDEDFPDEMKMTEKDGTKEIEFIRTIGVLTQGMRELLEKVEALEAR